MRSRAIASEAGPGIALAIRGLATTFATSTGLVHAVDGIDLDVRAGEVLGLVGESGCGKSVTLRSLVRLVRPPGRIEGRAIWQGKDLLALPERELRDVRGKEIAMIFQEPMTALNPVLTIRQQIDENLKAHTGLGRAERTRRAIELLDLVGIPSAAERLDSYPHQFSGGMRQRVMIAIALASQPRLLLELRDRLGMSVILVTHDLGVVAQTCDRVAVMYAGQIMEVGPVVEVFRNPRHAYTLGLLGSMPGGGTIRQPLRSIEGAPPSLIDLPRGCPFAPRCTFVTAACRQRRPDLVQVGADHLSACVHHDQVAKAAS